MQLFWKMTALHDKCLSRSPKLRSRCPLVAHRWERGQDRIEGGGAAWKRRAPGAPRLRASSAAVLSVAPSPQRPPVVVQDGMRDMRELAVGWALASDARPAAALGTRWPGEQSRSPGSAQLRSLWSRFLAVLPPLLAPPGRGPLGLSCRMPRGRGLYSLRQGGALRGPHRQHHGTHTHQTPSAGGDSGSARLVDNTPLTWSWGEPRALLGSRLPGGDNLFLKAHMEKRSCSCANTARSLVPARTWSP